jgi:hypothetical protein
MRLLVERADAVADIRECLVGKKLFTDNPHRHRRPLDIRAHRVGDARRLGILLVLKNSTIRTDLHCPIPKLRALLKGFLTLSH